MPESYDLHSDFDIQKHKENFINYLEVVIHPDGSVHYAVPSHQEYLIRYICEHRNITREELEAKCPREYYCDFMTCPAASVSGAIWPQAPRSLPSRQRRLTSCGPAAC